MIKTTIVIVAFLLPLVPVTEWAVGLVDDIAMLAESADAGQALLPVLLYYLARVLALVGFTLMFYQFLLSARLPVLEKELGRPNLIKRHRSLGKLGFLLILAHGLVMLLFDLIDHGAIIFTTGKLLGIVALFLLITAVIAAWHFKALQFSRTTWKRFHAAAYVVFPLAFLHAVLIGTVAGRIGPTRVVFSLFLAVYAYVAVRKAVGVIRERRKSADGSAG